jgi:hypothetical protein
MYLSEHVSESLPRDINAVSSKKGIIAFELTKPEAKGSSKEFFHVSHLSIQMRSRIF